MWLEILFAGVGTTIAGGLITIFVNKYKKKTKRNSFKLQVKNAKNSPTIQVAGNLSVGVSYSEAKQIAIDVFKSNFIELSKEASDVALSRVNKFADQLLDQIQNSNINLIQKFNRPEVQNALYNAEIGVAKSTDNHRVKLLTEVLIGRLESEPQEQEINYDEAIVIIPKLTNLHLDILALQIELLNPKQAFFKNSEELINYLQKHISPLLHNIIDGNKNQTIVKRAIEDHLVYLGLTQNHTFNNSQQLNIAFESTFMNFITSGFTIKDFNTISGNSEKLRELIVPHFKNTDKCQFGYSSASILRSVILNLGFDESYYIKLIALVQTNKKKMEDPDSSNDIISELISIDKELKMIPYQRLLPIGKLIGTHHLRIKTSN